MNYVQQCTIGRTNIAVYTDNNTVLEYLQPFRSSFIQEDLSLYMCTNDTLHVVQADKKHQEFFDTHCGLVALFRELEDAMPQTGAIILHAGVFRIADLGIVFAAKSGVGKTTHMMHWKQLFGSRVRIIEYDKPIIRVVGNKVMAYRSPWVSTEGRSEEEETCITDICFLERSEKNAVIRISPEEGKELLTRTIRVSDQPETRMRQREIICQIADNVRFWLFKCNQNADSAELAYQALQKEKWSEQDQYFHNTK